MSVSTHLAIWYFPWSVKGYLILDCFLWLCMNTNCPHEGSLRQAIKSRATLFHELNNKNSIKIFLQMQWRSLSSEICDIFQWIETEHPPPPSVFFSPTPPRAYHLSGQVPGVMCGDLQSYSSCRVLQQTLLSEGTKSELSYKSLRSRKRVSQRAQEWLRVRLCALEMKPSPFHLGARNTLAPATPPCSYFIHFKELFKGTLGSILCREGDDVRTMV